MYDFPSFPRWALARNCSLRRTPLARPSYLLKSNTSRYPSPSAIDEMPRLPVEINIARSSHLWYLYFPTPTFLLLAHNSILFFRRSRGVLEGRHTLGSSDRNPS